MIEALRKALSNRARRRLERADRAAVLVPIVDDSGPLRLILTRRTETLPSHQGQVAFPGGFVRPGESDPITTALREAEEEIGLPAECVEIIGVLDDLPTHTDTITVTPVVGRITRLPALTPQSGEVARIFTIPVADLRTSGRWRTRMDRGPAGNRRIDYFEHDGEILWGLSARIVLDILGRIQGDPA